MIELILAMLGLAIVIAVVRGIALGLWGLIRCTNPGATAVAIMALILFAFVYVCTIVAN